MSGALYLLFAVMFGIVTAMIGRSKGSSPAIWFLIGAVVPVIGAVAALAYRNDGEEPRRRCPGCGRTCMLHDALCVGCGSELHYVAPDELVGAPSGD